MFIICELAGRKGKSAYRSVPWDKSFRLPGFDFTFFFSSLPSSHYLPQVGLMIYSQAYLECIYNFLLSFN